MDELNRALGRLEGEVKSLNERMGKVLEKLDHLDAFKWKIIGISTAGSFLLSLIVSVLVVFVK